VDFASTGEHARIIGGTVILRELESGLEATSDNWIGPDDV